MNDINVKKAYIKPETKVVNMELEKPILTGSGTGDGLDMDNGGFWG